ncbi:peroxisomal dehydratase [Clavulina sp. PMI_390]|nr:peroxisomal dehydratase [Clavulina sp. PMI_390]
MSWMTSYCAESRTSGSAFTLDRPWDQRPHRADDQLPPACLLSYNKTTNMAPQDPGSAVGYEFPDTPVAWTTRDLLLYAVGIGARKDEYSLVYELDKGFAAFPTFPVVLGFKGTNPEVVDFNKSVTNAPKTPGLPVFPPGRIVHGSQSVEILRPIPNASGDGWKLKKRVVGVHENKSGVIVETELLLVDGKGTPYTRMLSATFNVGGKITGQKFDKAIAKFIQPSKAVAKGTAPQYTFTQKISDEQAIIYRLSGDYNPLHIDPTIGQKAGFGGIILHGLCSYGVTARGLVQAIGGGDPNSLKAISSRFTSPVKLGDTLEVRAWELGAGPDGTTEFAFETINLATGKPSLGGGVAYIKKASKSKL